MTVENTRRHFVIPGFEKYGITVDGNVLEFASSKTVDWVFPISEGSQHKVPYVYIDGELIAIPFLLINTFVGPANLQIRCSGNAWYKSRCVTYTYAKFNPVTSDEFFLDNVRFKRIPSYQTYAISEDGVVFDLKNHNFVHHTYTPNHYRCISLRTDANQKNYDRKVIHRLVYETYIGEIDPDKVVDHKDTNIYHNHYSNLEQMTQEENIHKSYFDKTGKNQNRMKWTIENIETMCQMMEDGYSTNEIAAALETEVDEKLKSLLARIRSGQSYKQIGARYDFSKYGPEINRRVLSPRERKRAIQMLIDEYSISDIASEFKCDKQTISLLAREENLTARTKKFTSDQAAEIKAAIDSGMSVAQAMREFDSCRNTIIRIKRGKYEDVWSRHNNKT